MNSRKIIVAILLLLIMIWTVWYWFPVLEALLTHQKTLTTIILTKNDPTRAINYPNGMLTPAAWILLLLLALVGLGVYSMSVGPSKAHGSARHANRRDTHAYRRAIRPFAAKLAPGAARSLAAYRPNWLNKQPREQRLLLGKYGWSSISLAQHIQQQNVLLTAMIGSGKTFGLVMRNLLRECGHRSLFISDVKGELVRKVAGYLSRFYEVWVFSPLKAHQSDGYNPLMHVHNTKDALQLAQCWASNTGDGKGSDAKFWLLLVVRAMNATILHLRTAEPDAPFSRLADILSQSSYEELRTLLLKSPSQVARREAKQFFDALDRNDKIVAGLMADLGNRFQLFLDDDVRVTTAYNTIDFVAMAEHPIALFLAIPPRATEMCAPLLACFVSHMWNEWELRAEQEPDGQLPLKVECYLDEFANLGRIYNLKEHLTTMRHTGVGLIIILQSFSQIDDLYGKALRNILLTNCGTHLLLAGAGLEETRFYSERIGDTTVQTTSHNVSGGGFLAVQNHSWTTSETRRRLFTPEELRTMKRDQMLVLGSAAPPILVETMSYGQDRAVRHLADLPFPHATVRPSSSPNHSTIFPPVQVGGPPTGQQKQQPATASTIIVDADDHSGLAPE